MTEIDLCIFLRTVPPKRDVFNFCKGYDYWEKVDLKGAWSRGFRRFLVKTVLKLSIANFIHAQHCVRTFKGTY